MKITLTKGFGNIILSLEKSKLKTIVLDGHGGRHVSFTRGSTHNDLIKKANYFLRMGWELQNIE